MAGESGNERDEYRREVTEQNCGAIGNQIRPAKISLEPGVENECCENGANKESGSLCANLPACKKCQKRQDANCHRGDDQVLCKHLPSDAIVKNC